MKTARFATLLCALGFASSTFGQVVVGKWTFETSPPADLIDSATISGIAADQGSGTASGVHASAATDWTTPFGNGSSNSLNANNWAIGDYFQFSTSTTGLTAINLSWDQTRSSTGSTLFDLEYSINGGAFSTAINDFTVIENVSPNAWNDTTPRPAASFSYNFGSLLDNATTVSLRLTAANAPGGSSGTVRIDNFTMTAIPEPSTYALLVGLGTLGVVAWRRKKLKAA